MANHESAVVHLQRELAGGRDVNDQTWNEKSALHYAAKYGNTKAATLLISKGANLNATAALYQLARRPEKLKVGWTPLHYAVRSEQAALVRLLLKHGANAATQSKQKETPYELAWIEFREEALWALTDSGGMRRGGQGSRLTGRRQLPQLPENLPLDSRLGFDPDKHLAPTMNHLERLLLRSVSSHPDGHPPTLASQQTSDNCAVGAPSKFEQDINGELEIAIHW